MAIPPVTLNLLQLLPGDDQNIHTDKINYNFDQILSLGGGPPGLTGSIGSQGVPGSQGIQGFVGDPGTPGTKWYVQSTIPSVSPAPEIGDYWFNTDTLDVSTWDGASWVAVGTLTIAGVFKDALSDTDRVIFTNPTPLKSLILSPLDYGVGAPQGGAYKLKLIGTSGSNIMNFGVVESGAVENSSALQSYITVSTITPSSKYGFSIVNPAGPIEVNAPGTTLKLAEQTGGVSNYELNGLSLKIQINPTDRNLGFAPAVGSGLGFHIGAQDALTNPSSRGLSVIDHADGFKVSLRGAHSAPVTSDALLYDEGIFFDSTHKQLVGTANSRQLWMRNRGLISAVNNAALNIETVRTFNDAGNGVDPWRSVRMSLQAKIDVNDWHAINFEGGAFDATENARPAMRFTVPGGGTRAGQDINGYWSFGLSTFHQLNNSTVNVKKQFKTNINIEGPAADITEGLDIFGGLHFVPNAPTSGASKRMGITAGLYHGVAGTEAVSSTHAGMLFKKISDELQIEFSTSNAGVPISGTAGALTRQTIKSSGEIQFHGMKNSTEVVPRDYKLKFLMDWDATAPGVGDIFAFDSAAHGGVGMYKDIVLQSQQSTFTDADNANFRGGGNLGIGKMSDFLNKKPQTKLHVFGPTTFGGRQLITDYVTDVVPTSWYNNWTFGFEHKSNAHNALILGGTGSQILDPVENTVIIGSVPSASAVLSTAASSDMVVIPSFTYMTTEPNWGTATNPAPYKSGIYEIGYTAPSGTDAQTRFGVNTPSARTTARIAFTGSAAANKAANGLDLILNREVRASLPFGGGPQFTPPAPRGYYLQCIAHVNNTALVTPVSDNTAFIITGENKVGIGGVPRYLPNNPNFDITNPVSWGTSLGTNSFAKWVDHTNATLQIRGIDGAGAAQMVIENNSFGTSLTNNAENLAVYFRENRNNPNFGLWAANSAYITTPNAGRTGVNARRASSAPFVIQPGLLYVDPDNYTLQRVHGSTLYLQGGEVGMEDYGGAGRGGDVVIHGGACWEDNDLNQTVGTYLNNNPDLDSGYGNVSLAYDWKRGSTAGSVSIGTGTPVMTMYTGRIAVTKTGVSTGTVTLTAGKDHTGTPFTVTGGFNANTGTTTVQFPTLPTSNIICITNMDTSTGNHYMFNVFCSGRTTSSVNITITTLGHSTSGWTSGTVWASFIVYCLPN